MAYPIERKLVVGISSNALFDLQKEDGIFQKKGLAAYRKYQHQHQHKILDKGVAFPFIKRFLQINNTYTEEQPVEVVLLSRNSPETGIRVFNSIKEHELNISRAAFMSGGSAIQYIPALNISLFLSTNQEDVKQAVDQGFPAGVILQTDIIDDEDDQELRVAFDFDGVVADDEAERIYKDEGLASYHQYEASRSEQVHNTGPLADFFRKLAYFQKMESRKKNCDKLYRKILKTAIITARNAPAHERAIRTLNTWGVDVDEMFLLGGIDKSRILSVLKPHLYFDDQKSHLNTSNAQHIPLVHIPFGIANEEKA